MPARRPRILVVLPTEWDQVQIPAWLGKRRDYEPILGDLTDAECPDDLEPLDYAAELASRYGGRIEGVFSSSDYPGATIAALVAERLGLPGARPDRLIRASHKYYARQDHREVAPDAVPDCALLEPGAPLPDPFPLEFPCFVKPVKGAFSRCTRRVESPEDLRRFLELPEVRAHADGYVAIYNRLVASLTDLEHDGRYFLAEQLVHGRQVTVEGYVEGGAATILGTVDSRFHAGTHSFWRFDYPSELPKRVRTRLEDVAARVALASGLDRTLFNVEMAYELATGRIGVIELNPRMCGQFADLYEKVDGTHGYEVACELAVGRTPKVKRGVGAFRAAASVPLRTFQRVAVDEAPDAMRVRETQDAYPGTVILNECRTGDRLERFEDEDGASIRFGVVNLGGDSRADIYARTVAIVDRLGYRFEPLP